MYVPASQVDSMQLGGIGSSLKKLVKKVTKPIAHIGAAVLTGGQSLTLSAKMIADKKAAQAMTAANKAAAADAAGETQANFDADRYIRENYATANWGKGSTATKNLAKWTADPWGHWNKYGRKLGWAFPYKTAASVAPAPITATVPVQSGQAAPVRVTVPSGSAALTRALQTATPIAPQPSYYAMPGSDALTPMDAGAAVPAGGMDTKKLMLYGGLGLGAVVLLSMMARRRS